MIEFVDESGEVVMTLHDEASKPVIEIPKLAKCKCGRKPLVCRTGQEDDTCFWSVGCDCGNSVEGVTTQIEIYTKWNKLNAR